MPDAGQISVLIVDDELLVARAIGNIVRRAGCAAAVFSAPQAALSYLESGNRPDLVISDTNMPEIRGPQFLVEVRRLAPNALRVIMSGLDGGEARQTVQSGVAHDYMPKPWDGPESVLAFVQMASARRLRSAV